MSKGWFKARDYFLGMNDRARDVKRGLELALKCTDDDDAKWLCSLFPEGVQDGEHARIVLETHSYTDTTGRALCFLAVLNGVNQLDRLKKAERCGCHLATALLCHVAANYNGGGSEQEERLKRATQSGERLALFVYADACLRKRRTTSHVPLREEIDFYKRAAELGCAQSMITLMGINRMYLNVQTAILCAGRMAKRHSILAERYLIAIASQRPISFKTLFWVGEQFVERNLSNRTEDTQVCASFYWHTRSHALAAVHAWTGVAIRMRVVRDIRNLIARQLWRDKIAWASK
jgi:hypothetical protein